MSYEMIAERLRDVPETALVEIWHYIEFICSKYAEPSNSLEKDTAFIDEMAGLFSAEEMTKFRQECNLSFKEINQ